MRIAESILLRIVVGEEDRYLGRPLYPAIVAKALESKMAGATVLFCQEGFGRSRTIRREIDVNAGPLMPVAIEIVDSEARIEQFLPVIHDMVESGLVTLERVHAIRYPRGGAASATPS
jgi:uncharacterized protein